MARAFDDGQLRILREGRITSRALAEVEDRASRGFNSTSMYAVGTKTGAGPLTQQIGIFTHACRILHSGNILVTVVEYEPCLLQIPTNLSNQPT